MSNGGGLQPRWTDDGAWLYYVQRENESLWRVAVESGAELRLGAPEKVLDDFYAGGNSTDYDISPDGTRFMTMLAELEESFGAASEIRVVPQWTRTLDAGMRYVR